MMCLIAYDLEEACIGHWACYNKALQSGMKTRYEQLLVFSKVQLREKSSLYAQNWNLNKA